MNEWPREILLTTVCQIHLVREMLFLFTDEEPLAQGSWVTCPASVPQILIELRPRGWVEYRTVTVLAPHCWTGTWPHVYSFITSIGFVTKDNMVSKMDRVSSLRSLELREGRHWWKKHCWQSDDQHHESEFYFKSQAHCSLPSVPPA